MVTGALLVVALAVAPIAWAAPIFGLGGSFLCNSWWDYCDDDDDPNESPISPSSGGIAIHNAVVVNVSGNIQAQGNGTPGLTTSPTNMPMTMGNGAMGNGMMGNGMMGNGMMGNGMNGNGMMGNGMMGNGMMANETMATT